MTDLKLRGSCDPTNAHTRKCGPGCEWPERVYASAGRPTLSADPELLAIMLEELARAADLLDAAHVELRDARLEHAAARILTATRALRVALGVAS
jgi:hypothetical protein